MDPKSYNFYYTNNNFWRKVKRTAGVAGQKVIHSALLLYYVLQRKDVPMWVKGAVLGSLGYFILPFDAIPDIAPLLGFTDDASMLAGTLWAVSKYIDEGVQARATQKLHEWFSESDNGDISEVDKAPPSLEGEK